MNFAMAPPKKLMNNVGRTMAMVWTMFVTDRTWEHRDQKPTCSTEDNFIWLKIPSRLEASALSEGRWRWPGTCQRQGQIDSVWENLGCNDKSWQRWPKRKSHGYRGEKPIPYDRVVDKSVHDQVGIPGTNCSHRLDHWSPQLPSIEEIWFLSVFSECVLFLLGPCVANVYHEKCCICHNQTNSCKT